jgi:hypothetical protein
VGNCRECYSHFVTGYLQTGNEARGTPRRISEKIDGKRIKRCSWNAIVCNNLIESRYNRNVEDMKPIFNLNLPELAAEFTKAIWGKNDVIVFSIRLLFNETKGTYAQKDQRQEK